MDNHPIPQDVTGFQFKLIGNMTVKQFAYLAVGVILGWVFLQLPGAKFITIPFSAFFTILGIGLAFIPIGGRPMDIMIGNFIRALFRPTQFVYEKSGTPLYFSSGISIQAKQNLNPVMIQKTIITPSPAHLTTLNMPTFQPNIQPNISASLNVSQIQKPSAPIAPIAKEEPMIQAVPKNTFYPISKSVGRNSGMPSAPDSPSVITGMTRDPRGNPLSNILVEVKDREGNPVRAFKTNEVGRFASATPLINGAYTIEFEDPKGQNKFEIKTINIAGQIVPPLEAISIDTREELRRSLFSVN